MDEHAFIERKISITLMWGCGFSSCGLPVPINIIHVGETGAQGNKNHTFCDMTTNIIMCVAILLAGKHTATCCIPDIERMKSPQI